MTPRHHLCKVCGRRHHPWQVCEPEEEKSAHSAELTGIVLCLIGFLAILFAAALYAILSAPP